MPVIIEFSRGTGTYSSAKFELYKENHITQEQLSVKSDVSFGSIKRFERTGEISLSSLIKIAFALGLENDFDYLFSKKGYSSIQEVIDEQ